MTNADLGVVVDVTAERKLWSSGRSGVAGAVRVVGRTGSGDHDRDSDRRYRRSTCFAWGRRFFDCSLAFTAIPGTVGAEAELNGRTGRWSGQLWGGWFVAAAADEVGSRDGVPQEDGDWMWIGARVAADAAKDITIAAAVLTGGRLRDSLDQSRVPLLTSDLARTTVVVHLEARL